MQFKVDDDESDYDQAYLARWASEGQDSDHFKADFDYDFGNNSDSDD